MRHMTLIPLLLLFACSSQEDSWTHAEIGPARVGQAGETFNFDNPAMADHTAGASLLGRLTRC